MINLSSQDFIRFTVIWYVIWIILFATNDDSSIYFLNHPFFNACQVLEETTKSKIDLKNNSQKQECVVKNKFYLHLGTLTLLISLFMNPYLCSTYNLFMPQLMTRLFCQQNIDNKQIEWYYSFRFEIYL